jgi:hypothetical protein
LTSSLEHAGCWFLHSGIQEASGGVARYYRAEAASNLPVSNEITGYFASAMVELHRRTGRSEYLDAAMRAARFLTHDAWDAHGSIFPFEPGSGFAYFFDTGIIIRGLLAVWRVTGQKEFHARAKEAALSLAFDFMSEPEFAPVISLPDKQPLPYEPRWSRRPGCFQLKAALAWLEIGDPQAGRLFETMLELALSTHDSFLAFEQDRENLMDWLHPQCYFLEALLWVADRDRARRALETGIARTGALLRELAPGFERSDVYSQLLRVRLIAHHLGAVELDQAAASEEARQVASFQEVASTDPRVRGGFWFGRKGPVLLPFSNPVSTSFGMQALELWDDHCAGRWDFELHRLI